MGGEQQLDVNEIVKRLPIPVGVRVHLEFPNAPELSTTVVVTSPNCLLENHVAYWLSDKVGGEKLTADQREQVIERIKKKIKDQTGETFDDNRPHADDLRLARALIRFTARTKDPNDFYQKMTTPNLDDCLEIIIPINRTKS